MTSDEHSGTPASCDEMADVLSRVRHVDPTAEEAAVAGYVQEISEASALLDGVDLTDAALVVSFSPSWPEGSAS